MAGAGDVEGRGKHDDFVRIAEELGDSPSGRLEALWRQALFWSAAALLLPIRLLLNVPMIIVIYPLLRLCVCMDCCAARPSAKAAPDGSLPLVPHSAAQLLVLRSLWLPYRLWLLLCWGVARVKVRHVAGSPAEPPSAWNATIVANHVSFFDGTVLGCAFGFRFTFIVISWIVKIPLLGITARAFHGAPVVPARKQQPRADAATAKVVPAEDCPAADLELRLAPEEERVPPATSKTEERAPTATSRTVAEYQRQCATDPSLVPLIIFPEGTTHAARCLIKFRKGAFVSGQPVRPVVLRYPPRMGWVQGLRGHLLAILTQWFYAVEVIRLPLYVPSEAERDDPQLYADNVQAVMARALELPPERVSATVGKWEILEASRFAR